MRQGRENGITLFQILIVVALLWAVVLFIQTPPTFLNGIFNRDEGAREYFNRVLIGIERAREVDERTPYKQPCESFTLGRADTSDVQSCSYEPSASRDFYMVVVVSKSGEVFRYAGRGPK